MYTRVSLHARHFAGVVLGVGLAAAGAQAALPPATDLAADGAGARARGATVVVLFTIENCRYCETVKRRYLEPLAKDPRWRDRVFVREVNASLGASLKDFDGASTNHARFAAFQGVQFYPTVRFFGPDGGRRAPDIVGQVIDDYYWAYLRDAVRGEE
jgi:hypothetical protein